MSSGDNQSEALGDFQHTPLLDTINSPDDLKSLSVDDLKQLAMEVRRKIILTASTNGGHLAPHLGVVELTLAIHYVFDTKRDILIWDVGHQCYAHKLVTGRREQFSAVRTKGGISSYPRPTESPYDAFAVGHSSTSISAALGMAVARDFRGEDRRIIAVIGDGAMTAGMAFEALSHAGHLGKDLLVVLNDNSMSISPSVGALSAYFSRLITGGVYTRAKEDFGAFMKRMLGPRLTRAAQRLEHSVKGLFVPGALFEALGCRYVGPVDGHDLPTLVECFTNLKKAHGPVFFHCVTQKGKGYKPAEEDPETYHGVRAFDISTGKFQCGQPPARGTADVTFTDVFAEAMLEAGEEDDTVMAITAAMPVGTGLSCFARRFPERFFDVGICEQHAVTFSAGLAARGLRPVCAIYSTFLQRAYDQVLHDVCLQGLPVVFAVDRGGAVGEDSPTHQGAFDLSFLRVIPNITVMAPRDGEDLRTMLFWALKQPGPVAIRYPRGKAVPIGPSGPRNVTSGEVLREGTDVFLLGVGPCLAACLEAADRLSQAGISVGVADARLVRPLDTALLDRIRHTPIVTVEENTVRGGFGCAVIEYFEQKGYLQDVRVRSLGFPDAFMEHATREEQLHDVGLDAEGIAAGVRAFLTKIADNP